jgi:hypothetical protein
VEFIDRCICRGGIMTISLDQLVISPGVFESLPLYYRAMAQHLADTGRVIIGDPSEKEQE